MTETFNSTNLTLQKWEEIVNTYARQACIAHQIKAEHFEVRLVTELRDNAIMGLIPGNPVLICLRWPAAHEFLNTQLRSAFSTIKRYKLRRTMEVVPVAMIKRNRAELKEAFKNGMKKKEWSSKRFIDEEDIIFDLVPKRRLKVSEMVITKLEDTLTGESITVHHTGKATRFEGENVGMWLELSRIVREKHPEGNYKDDPCEPELTEALKLVGE